MSPSENMVQVSNRRRYFSPSVLRGYTSYNLMRAEALVLLKYQPRFAQKSVLDIGIGAGRTTVYLAPLAGEYVGIDFSPAFIDFVNNSMPSVNARLCDMRYLGEFSAEVFDFAMGSFNVLDIVTHEDRIRTLAEVRRVLKPGGMFVFSSHNRTHEAVGSAPRPELNWDPVRQARLLYRWARQSINYRKWKKHWVFADEYAIVTDVGHDFTTLHYYIDHKTSRSQLDANGFSVLEVFDIDGHPLAPDDVDTTSAFLTYVVQKK